MTENNKLDHFYERIDSLAKRFDENGYTTDVIDDLHELLAEINELDIDDAMALLGKIKTETGEWANPLDSMK